MWTVAMEMLMGFWLSGLLDTDGPQQGKVLNCLNSLALQRYSHIWKQMNTEFVVILAEPKTGLGTSDNKVE